MTTDRRWSKALSRALALLVAPLAWLNLLRLHRLALALAVGLGVFVLIQVRLFWPKLFRRISGLPRRIANGAAEALDLALSALIFAVTVVPLWTLGRLFGYSGLDPGWGGASSAWLAAPGRKVRPDCTRIGLTQPWTETTPVAPRVRRRRQRRFVVAVAATVAVILTIGGWPYTVHSKQHVTVAGQAISGYSHEHEPWFQELARELNGYNYTVWDPILGASLTDYHNRYVNIVGGHRVSYEPAHPTLTVWYLGGSTMFGIGQRDDHTIPSVIGHLAESEGLRLRSVNLAVSGFNNWQETEVLSQQLTLHPAPDLVVYYDGVNELASLHERELRGDVDPNRLSRELFFDDERHLWSLTHPKAGPATTDSSVAIAGNQYGRGVRLSQHLAAAYHFSKVDFWQPALATKQPSLADGPVLQQMGYNATAWRATRKFEHDLLAASGAQPIDLTTALDAIKAPVYFDSSHTNEMGASLVAQKIYFALRPILQRLAARNH